MYRKKNKLHYLTGRFLKKLVEITSLKTGDFSNINLFLDLIQGRTIALFVAT